VSDELLEIDLRLLLLRYGRQKVLQALAHLTDESAEQLHQRLVVVEEKRAKPKSRKPPPAIIDVVKTAAADRPELLDPLRTLAVEFENRTFLPQLRDVERFLDRIGAAHGKLKSRSAAAPVLIRALAKLSRDDLAKLASHDKGQGESDYSLLARAIMGPTAKSRESAHSPAKGTKP
jgi:hypothetical protein